MPTVAGSQLRNQ